MIGTEEVGSLERCLAAGGVALLPTDTLYGLACDPDSRAAVEALYALKGRRPDKPAAVMFGSLEPALAALAELGPACAAAARALLPGPATLLLPNPRRRFPLACAGNPEVLGLRVPDWPPALAALAALERPLLQSSANLAGGEDARRLADVPGAIRSGASLCLDGGELPGLASTIVDLCAFEHAGRWQIARSGALAPETVAEALDAVGG